MRPMAEKTTKELLSPEGNDKVGMEIFKLVTEVMEDRKSVV